MRDPEPIPRSAGLPGRDDLPAFLQFTPVPVRARHDGWTSSLQLRFVVHLARGAGVDEAARRLGRSRQSAYALRERVWGGWGLDRLAERLDAQCAAEALRGLAERLGPLLGES